MKNNQYVCPDCGACVACNVCSIYHEAGSYECHIAKAYGVCQKGWGAEVINKKCKLCGGENENPRKEADSGNQEKKS